MVSDDYGWKDFNSWEDIPEYTAYEVPPVIIDVPLNILVSESFIHEVRDFSFRAAIECCIEALEALQPPSKVISDPMLGMYHTGKIEGLRLALATIRGIL